MDRSVRHDGASYLHVAVAIVEDPEGRVLVSRRPEHVHQGGLWEFPGGKLEAGETPEAALQRELREELGIDMLAARPLMRVFHSYPDKAVLLDVWRITRYRGAAAGLEGQPIEWVAAEGLAERRFPRADIPIIQALNLPERYLITPEPGAMRGQWIAGLQAALGRGISLVQLRAYTLSPSAYSALAEQVQELCSNAGARLLLNADPALACELGCAGVHLNSQRLLALNERPPGIGLLGASCHSLTEVRHAAAIGADFIIVSPVLETRSHPGAATIGFEGLRALTEQASMPVYALGGMRECHLEQVYRHGAQGIAAISGLWNQ